MNRRILPVLLAVAGLVFSVSCDGPQETLSVMAGSELENLEPFFLDIERATGLTLEMDYTGTLDGVDRLSQGKEVDLAWFSHAKYLTLIDRDRIVAQEKIMLSPVVLGVKKSLAEAWGWVDNPDLTWREIADKAEGGELR